MLAAPSAMTRSGIACASAPKTAPGRKCPRMCRAATGAGGSALRMLRGRRVDRHRAEAAFVVRHVRRQRALERIGGVGMGVVEHHIDPALALRGAARPIDVHAVAGFFDGDRELDRCLVTVRPDFVAIDAVGQFGNCPAHRLLRPVDDLVGQRLERFQPELAHELDQPLRADIVAGRLGVDVAEHRFRACARCA